VNADLHIHEVKKTDLVIIPAIDGDLVQAIDNNKEYLPWITDQYRKGAEVASLCVGAFLLAGTELYKMMFNKEKEKKAVVKNRTSLDRVQDMVELKWNQFGEAGFSPSQTIVVNASTNEEIPSQVTYNENEEPVSLIFQSGLTAGGTGYYFIKKQAPKEYKARVFGRFVPERFDDFAWENDRIAFRMYGAALDGRSDNAKGIDVWVKKTSDLIINKWYKEDDYHVDHGEGVDAYNVGITLGAGNSAPLTEKGLVFPANYQKYKILDQGPLRFTFQLNYKPWKVNGMDVEEVKTISIDAGSNMNRIVDHYQFAGTNLAVAAGVTKHNDDGSGVINAEKGFISYWDQSAGNVDNGKIGVSVMIPEGERVSFEDELDHLMAKEILTPGETFVYYQGAAWSKSGYFAGERAWINYLKNYSEKLRNPLEAITY
jgi:hypothetical protein